MEKATTSGQLVLLPESTRKHRKEHKITIAVNSRDRDLSADYDSNSFRWRLRRPLKDVVSIELLNGCIPADLYNINTGWNKFTFGESVGVWIITLTPGQYTSAQLATELQTKLNALTGIINTYAVTYSDITKKLTIIASSTIIGTGADDFSFYFLNGTYVDVLNATTGSIESINCPAHILGFERFDYTSLDGVLVAPCRADPDYCIQRVYLHVNADNSLELNRVEVGAGRKDCFHIIYMDSKEGYYYLNKDSIPPIYISYPAPISRISALTISVRDEFFRLVDLGRHNYTLLFEITYLN